MPFISDLNKTFPLPLCAHLLAIFPQGCRLLGSWTDSFWPVDHVWKKKRGEGAGGEKGNKPWLSGRRKAR